MFELHGCYYEEPLNGENDIDCPINASMLKNVDTD
jgi:hypothetical protein